MDDRNDPPADKRSELTARNFPTAQQEAAVQTPPSPYSGPESAYRLAFTDTQFLLREELRPVRMQLELLKPEVVQREQGIESTIVIFGSARIVPPDVAQRMLSDATSAGDATALSIAKSHIAMSGVIVVDVPTELQVERPKDTLRIATLVGAACLGVGVRWEETYSARLASFVGERVMPTEVLDAGVADYSVVQSLWRYRDLVRAYRPHVVILSVMGDQSVLQAPQGRTDLAQRAAAATTDLAAAR